MRTTFENLKIGSKFKTREQDEYNFTKVDDFQYSIHGSVGKAPIPLMVYAVQLSDLKNPKMQRGDTDLNIGKLLLIGFVIIWILSALLSSHNNNASEDATLKSAEQKIDRGDTDSLTDQEKRDVDKIWNNK
jgi:hypothetical protein